MLSIIVVLAALLDIVIIIALALTYSAFSWGLVLYKFWTWFILPVFITLPVITLVQAVGLVFFISLFKAQAVQVIKDEYLKKNYVLYGNLLTPWITLFIGYLVKVFIIG